MIRNDRSVDRYELDDASFCQLAMNENQEAYAPIPDR